MTPAPPPPTAACAPGPSAAACAPGPSAAEGTERPDPRGGVVSGAGCLVVIDRRSGRVVAHDPMLADCLGLEADPLGALAADVRLPGVPGGSLAGLAGLVGPAGAGDEGAGDEGAGDEGAGRPRGGPRLWPPIPRLVTWPRQAEPNAAASGKGDQREGLILGDDRCLVLGLDPGALPMPSRPADVAIGPAGSVAGLDPGLVWRYAAAQRRVLGLDALGRLTLEGMCRLCGLPGGILWRIDGDGSAQSIATHGPAPQVPAFHLPALGASPPVRLLPPPAGRSDRAVRLVILPDLARPPVALAWWSDRARQGWPEIADPPPLSLVPAATLADWRAAGLGAALGVRITDGGALWGLALLWADRARPLSAAACLAAAAVAEGFSAAISPCLVRSAGATAGGVRDTQVRATCLGHRLTEHRQAQREHGRQRLESLGHLAAGVAHEINNVLQPITGYAELGLMDAGDDPRMRECFSVIQEAADQAARIVRNIQIYARQNAPPPQPLALGPALDRAVAFVRRMPFFGLRLEVEIAADPGDQVLADDGELTQVVLNLVKNAWDAMDRKGVVRVRLDPVTAPVGARTLCGEGVVLARMLELSVADSGCGMTGDTAARAMAPFFSTKEAGEGTGLGLAIVGSVVGAWCGDLVLETAPGRGTTVRIRLPVLDDTWTLERFAACGPETRAACPRINPLVRLMDDGDPAG